MEQKIWFISKCESSANLKAVLPPQEIKLSHVFCLKIANICALSYKNKEALAAHGQSEVFVAVQKAGAEAQILAAAPDIKILQHVGGFASR